MPQRWVDVRVHGRDQISFMGGVIAKTSCNHDTLYGITPLAFIFSFGQESSMRSPRIFTVNRSLAKQLARGVHVGGQFAFVDLNAIDRNKVEFASDLHPAFSDVGAIASKGQSRLTIPIPHGKKLTLPGVNVKATLPPLLTLASLTCDRDLYRFGSDQVNVLVVDLDSPEREVCVDLLLGTSIASPTQFDQRHVLLNESGLGIVRFDDLPIGSYQVVRTDSWCEIDGCEFSVAGFELAPLVATIGQRCVSRLNQRPLAINLSVDSRGNAQPRGYPKKRLKIYLSAWHRNWGLAHVTVSPAS